MLICPVALVIPLHFVSFPNTFTPLRAGDAGKDHEGTQDFRSTFAFPFKIQIVIPLRPAYGTHVRTHVGSVS